MPAFERGVAPNPNAHIANAITKHFFPIIEEFLLLFRRFNPTMTAKFPRKMVPTDSNSARREFSAVTDRRYKAYFFSTSEMYFS